MSDYRTQMAAWNEYEESLAVLDVPVRFPHVPRDDPRFAKVEKIMAKFGSVPPSAPLPPGWEGPRPMCYDGTLDGLAEYLFGGLSAKDGDEGYPRGGPILHYSRVIRNAHHALHWFGLHDLLDGVPNGTPEAANVCDGLGQIHDLLDSVRGKIAEGWKRPRGGPAEETKPTKKGRRWTKGEADKAIVDYVMVRQGDYEFLAKAVAAGEKDAKRISRDTFGRNVIADKLGMAQGTVSASRTWQELKKRLKLGLEPRRSAGVPKRKRIGADIAVEEISEANSKSASDMNIEKEIIDRIRRAGTGEDYNRAADLLIHKLQSGEITTDQALQSVENFEKQQQCRGPEPNSPADRSNRSVPCSPLNGN